MFLYLRTAFGFTAIKNHSSIPVYELLRVYEQFRKPLYILDLNIQSPIYIILTFN